MHAEMQLRRRGESSTFFYSLFCCLSARSRKPTHKTKPAEKEVAGKKVELQTNMTYFKYQRKKKLATIQACKLSLRKPGKGKVLSFPCRSGLQKSLQ